MDTSETYIKMCRDANEVQKKQKPKDGDYYANFERIWDSIYDEDEIITRKVASVKLKEIGIWHDGYAEIKDKYLVTFLPRQDQIQGMFGKSDKTKTPWRQAYWLYDFAERHRNPYKMYKWDSMEQLWLAFYMHEKHSKTWDGEKWAKINL